MEGAQYCPKSVPIKHFTLFCTKQYALCKTHRKPPLFPSNNSYYFALIIMHFRGHTELQFVCYHQALHIIMH
jgi:hypothetical protein